MNNVADKCGGKKRQKIVVKCHVFSKDFETKTILKNTCIVVMRLSIINLTNVEKIFISRWRLDKHKKMHTTKKERQDTATFSMPEKNHANSIFSILGKHTHLRN